MCGTPYSVCLEWQILPRGAAFVPYVFTGHPNCICTDLHPGKPKNKHGSLGHLHHRLTLPGCNRWAGCPCTLQPVSAHFWQTLMEKWQSRVKTKHRELLQYLIMFCIKKCLWTYKVIENKGFESSDIETQTPAVQNCGSFSNWHLALEQQFLPSAQLLLWWFCPCTFSSIKLQHRHTLTLSLWSKAAMIWRFSW